MGLTKPDWFERTQTDRAAWAAGAPAPISVEWHNRPLSGETAQDTRTIIAAGRALARVQGAPPLLRIRPASEEAVGTAAAGFEDAPESFDKPFIVVDRSIFMSCPLEWALDVGLGVVLHEVGHILHTRVFYRRAAEVSPRLRSWVNMLEDERIEDLVIASSPGFAPYIHAARRYLIESSRLRDAVTSWNSLCPLDRLNSLIFAFIRAPHLIAPDMQTWIVVGERPFAVLRSMLSDFPRTEEAVWDQAQRIEDLWKRVQRCLSGPDAVPGDPDVERQALDAQEDARRLDDWIGRVLERGEELEALGELDEARQLLEGADALLAGGTPGSLTGVSTQPRDDRFGLTEMLDELDRANKVRAAFGPDEIAWIDLAATDIEANPVVPSESSAVGRWEWEGIRTTILEQPRADAEARARYEEALLGVRPHVRAMRDVFRFLKLEERPTFERDRTVGRIDPRRIALSRATGRVFRRIEPMASRRMALGLLLDASGSMSWGAPISRESAALKSAVLMVEALDGLDGVSLGVWSHTSTGEDDADCLIRLLFDPSRPDKHVLGRYEAEGNNYDHAAIEAVDRLLRDSAQLDTTRLLIVLSDGTPAGVDYGGDAAIEATRRAVDVARSRGTRILNVAIADYASERIFGAGNVLKFTDLDRLVLEIRRLITRLVVTGRIA